MDMTPRRIEEIKARVKAFDTYDPMAREVVRDDMLMALAALEETQRQNNSLNALFDHHATMESDMHQVIAERDALQAELDRIRDQFTLLPNLATTETRYVS